MDVMRKSRLRGAAGKISVFGLLKGADTASLSRETISEETGKQFSPDPRVISEDMSEYIRTNGTKAMPIIGSVEELRDTLQDLELTRATHPDHQAAFDALSHRMSGACFRRSWMTGHNR